MQNECPHRKHDEEMKWIYQDEHGKYRLADGSYIPFEPRNKTRREKVADWARKQTLSQEMYDEPGLTPVSSASSTGLLRWVNREYDTRDRVIEDLVKKQLSFMQTPQTPTASFLNAPAAVPGVIQLPSAPKPESPDMSELQQMLNWFKTERSSQLNQNRGNSNVQGGSSGSGF